MMEKKMETTILNIGYIGYIYIYVGFRASCAPFPKPAGACCQDHKIHSGFVWLALAELGFWVIMSSFPNLHVCFCLQNALRICLVLGCS